MFHAVTARYLPLLILLGLSLGLCGVLWLIGARVGPKHPTPEKSLPYECGNDTQGSLGVRPHLRFFLVAILLLVFDVEAVLIYPWAVLFRDLGWQALIAMSGFMGALLVALVYAWKKGVLEWQK